MNNHSDAEQTKHYYKATLQYDGTGYAGFQWQKNIPSIQNDFNLALQRLVTGKITTMGASRTDTGVHALKQVVKVTSENPITTTSFSELLNKNLPSQIKCLEFIPCGSHFKPANDPHSKEYRYFFTNIKSVENLDRRFIANFSMNLDLELMKDCLKEVLGTHDFQNFCSAGSNVKSTVRDIHFCELSEINPQPLFKNSVLFKLPPELNKCYQLRIEGNGFLKQMIRHLVSALWMVGSGKLTKDEFLYQLRGPKREKRLWKVASPSGLYLFDIKYGAEHG